MKSSRLPELGVRGCSKLERCGDAANFKGFQGEMREVDKICENDVDRLGIVIIQTIKMDVVRGLAQLRGQSQKISSSSEAVGKTENLIV